MPLGNYKRFNGERWRLYCNCNSEVRAKQLAEDIRSGKHSISLMSYPVRVRRDRTVLYVMPTGGWKMREGRK